MYFRVKYYYLQEISWGFFELYFKKVEEKHTTSYTKRRNVQQVENYRREKAIDRGFTCSQQVILKLNDSTRFTDVSTGSRIYFNN